MYISFHKVQLPGAAFLLIHLMTSLTESFPHLLQQYLNEHLDPANDLYDPAFPWDSAQLILLYHGLQELPDRGYFCLPEGRTVRMININPGHSGILPSLLSDYIQAMETGRQSLLTGDTPLEAALKIWVYCLRNDTMHTMTVAEKNFQRVVEDMERLQAALAEELSAGMPAKGGVSQ